MRSRSVLAFALLLATGCGYHVAGHADLVPKSIHSIAIPAFTNGTTRYKLTDELPAALSREFITRTRYRIETDPKTADATLEGRVISYNSFPSVFDPVSGRASLIQIVVTLQLTLHDRSGKVLFTRPRMEIRERYEIAVDQKAYLDESNSALERLSRDMARTVVSAILENF